ncbi:ubiquitin carboxyl-terminal hydrolase 16-like [Cyprinus carpio]|uniref:Ubiquitin carboxyl-terminal hydrolase 16-like n=1 Tax=Cyprinus carpio TaxID=7962 RepID=A0A9Q9X6J6_CYPCA|nr:ubiquitin carboxyl-terminal hydrolase 16-like [Cyprinus carpio]
MGKKKGKDRSPRADSSTETAGVSCAHIRKGTEHNLLKKAGLNEQWSSCQDCEPDKPVEQQISEDEPDRESLAVDFIYLFIYFLICVDVPETNFTVPCCIVFVTLY